MDPRKFNDVRHDRRPAQREETKSSNEFYVDGIENWVETHARSAGISDDPKNGTKKPRGSGKRRGKQGGENVGFYGTLSPRARHAAPLRRTIPFEPETGSCMNTAGSCMNTAGPCMNTALSFGDPPRVEFKNLSAILFRITYREAFGKRQ